MNEKQLRELLNDLVMQPHESEWVEFKLNFHSPEEIGEQISASPNGEVKEDDPDSKSRKYASYLPFWA